MAHAKTRLHKNQGLEDFQAIFAAAFLSNKHRLRSAGMEKTRIIFLFFLSGQSTLSNYICKEI
jgi:hypothetical protein